MPSVLTSGDTITCAHVGAIDKTLGNKLVVQSNPVLTGLGAVTSCPITPPPATNVKCTAVAVTAGLATKLKVGGVAVLLNTLVGSAKPPANPGGALVVTATPKKLNAV